MDAAEARRLLDQHLDQLVAPGYGGLVACINQNLAFEVEAESGRRYQLELDIVWDHLPGGALRILGSVDDGGLRAFLPLTASRLVLPPHGER